jgi:hypothetical protein
MSSFNAYRITELNSEISALKSKTDLLVDISHVHEAHLHHLEEKTDATNKLLVDLLESNIWFTTKITDAIKEVPVHCASPRKHGQIGPASLIGSRGTST